MKKIICLTLSCFLAWGQIQITPEIGANVGINDEQNLTYGAYGRLWLGVNDFVLAPQVRWELNQEYSNIKAGLIIGGEATSFLTPYIGASYSNFSKIYEDSFDVEAGIVFFMPFTSIGIYGNWGLAKEINSQKNSNVFGGGVSFGIVF